MSSNVLLYGGVTGLPQRSFQADTPKDRGLAGLQAARKQEKVREDNSSCYSISMSACTAVWHLSCC